MKNCIFLMDKGKEFQTVEPETETDVLSKVSAEKSGTLCR